MDGAMGQGLVCEWKQVGSARGLWLGVQKMELRIQGPCLGEEPRMCEKSVQLPTHWERFQTKDRRAQDENLVCFCPLDQPDRASMLGS